MNKEQERNYELLSVERKKEYNKYMALVVKLPYLVAMVFAVVSFIPLYFIYGYWGYYVSVGIFFGVMIFLQRKDRQEAIRLFKLG